MKANAPKRKIFDAVDTMTVDMAKAETGNGFQSLPVDKIKPFHDHPFRLYEGERLDDMVESIREHGVLAPVIVRKKGRGYEMLSGHNRLNAAKLAGLTEIPAIVKEDLSEEESYVYVIETNMIQRSFSELLPSEKAAVLAARYEKVISQGKRNDILREITEIEGNDGTCGHDVHKSKSRDSIGEEYGMTGRNIARYMRVDKLIPEFKEKLDEGSITLVAAVDLSYLSEQEQGTVAKLYEKGEVKLDARSAKAIRESAGDLTGKKIVVLHDGGEKKMPAATSIKIPSEVYQRFFPDKSPKEAADVVEQALEAWFRGKEAAAHV